MLIRNANSEDIAALARVHAESWRSAYAAIMPPQFLADLDEARSAMRFTENMAKPSQICVVAEDAHDGIVGFASGGPERTGDPIYRGELYACYLLQPHQRRGAGTRLFCEVAAQLERAGFNSMLAWVLVQNPACGFYEKLGGTRLRQQSIKIGNVEFPEVAYGWPDLRALRVKT